MKQIIINSKKYGQKAVLVDDSDFDSLNQFKWHLYKDRHTYYAVRRQGKTKLRMHRFLLGLTDPDIFGDHIDHNGLNNQRSNLRIATPSESCANRTSQKNTTSKYKGVCLDRLGKRWQVHIVKGGKQKYLGLFDTEIEGALAYNKAAIELHGEFACLNKITA